MISVKSRRVNVARMKSYRQGRHLPQFWRERVDRDDMIDQGEEVWEAYVEEIVRNFSHKLRAKRMWDKPHKKYSTITQELYYDIDYNQFLVHLEERWTKEPPVKEFW